MKYKNYEISAVREEDGCTLTCADDDPEMIDFGLYGIDDEDCRRWVSDHPTRAEAEAEMKRLLST